MSSPSATTRTAPADALRCSAGASARNRVVKLRWFATRSSGHCCVRRRTRKDCSPHTALRRCVGSGPVAARSDPERPGSVGCLLAWGGNPLVRACGDGESACKRDSVGAVPCGSTSGGHPSVRPTRGLPGDLRRRAEGQSMPSARPCSGWGLPSRPGRPGRWCALTAPLHPYLCGTPGGVSPSAVYFLWHFPAGRPDWVLPSTLPCGVRTFLGPVKPARGRLADSPPPAMLPAR